MRTGVCSNSLSMDLRSVFGIFLLSVLLLRWLHTQAPKALKSLGLYIWILVGIWLAVSPYIKHWTGYFVQVSKVDSWLGYVNVSNILSFLIGSAFLLYLVRAARKTSEPHRAHLATTSTSLNDLARILRLSLEPVLTQLEEVLSRLPGEHPAPIQPSECTPPTSLQLTAIRKSAKKKPNKKGQKKPNEDGGGPSSPVTASQVLNAPLEEDQCKALEGKSLLEVFRSLAKQVADLRNESKRPPYLTDHEKSLAVTSLGSLFSLWKQLDERPESPTDEEDIGILTPAESELPRRTISQIIVRRKNQAQVNRLKDQGVEISICDRCGGVARKGHTCWLSSWSTPIRDSAMVEKTLVVQQGKGPIKISQKKLVDSKRLAELDEQVKGVQAVNKTFTSAPNTAQPSTRDSTAHEPIVIDESDSDSEEPMEPQPTTQIAYWDPSPYAFLGEC